MRIDGKPLNAPYPVGVTQIIWTAKDAANNTKSCNQTIVVMVPADDRKHGGSDDDEEALLLVVKALTSLLTAAW